MSGFATHLLEQGVDIRVIQVLFETDTYCPPPPDKEGDTSLPVSSSMRRDGIGTDLVVIPQPDGTVTCIPAWMTHKSAARHKVSVEPNLSLNVLRALRAEADTLLRFLRSNSGMEEAEHDAQASVMVTIRGRRSRVSGATAIWPSRSMRLSNPEAAILQGNKGLSVAEQACALRRSIVWRGA